MFIFAQIPVPKMEIGGNLLILLVVITALIIRYLIAKSRNKVIIKAIEKGLAPSELKTGLFQTLHWTVNITSGIAFLIIGSCILFFALIICDEWKPSLLFNLSPSGVIPVAILFLGVIIFGVGISRLIRGIFQKKLENTSADTKETPNK